MIQQCLEAFSFCSHLFPLVSTAATAKMDIGEWQTWLIPVTAASMDILSPDDDRFPYLGNIQVRNMSDVLVLVSQQSVGVSSPQGLRTERLCVSLGSCGSTAHIPGLSGACCGLRCNGFAGRAGAFSGQQVQLILRQQPGRRKRQLRLPASTTGKRMQEPYLTQPKQRQRYPCC